MQCNNFKKCMITGLASVLCVGSMSVANLPSFNGNYVATAYAATIKDTTLKATGTIKSNVFLRKGPGTSYDKITVLKKDAKVDIVAKSSNNWYKVKYGKGFGYVYSDYVVVKDNKPVDKKEDISYIATGTAKSNVYVRKAASTSSKKLGTIKKASTINIVAKNYNGKWFKIKYNDDYGYVSAKYITISSDKPEVKYPVTVVANHAVYIRESNSPKAKILGVLNKDAKATATEKTKNNWYKIQYKNGFGYVYGEYLNVVANS